MRSRKTRLALTVLGVVAAAGAMPLATATSASADQIACANYVGSNGYAVGPKVRAACSHEAIFSGIAKSPNPYCLTGLTSAGVRSAVAQVACKRA